MILFKQGSSKRRKAETMSTSAYRNHYSRRAVALSKGGIVNNNHGGQRKGAGRKPTGRPRKVKTSITLAPDLLAHAEATGNRSAYIEALIRRDTMRTFTLTAIRPDDLSAADLRQEAAGLADVEAYRVTIYDADGIKRAPEAAEALWMPSEGRLGIAWGAEATWGDAQSVEAGVEMWLNDAVAWEAAN